MNLIRSGASPLSGAGLHELALWAHQSDKGERREYFRGDLATERAKAHLADICLVTGDNLRRTRLQAANVAFELANGGFVVLSQQRHGDHDHSYFMTSTGRGTMRNQTPIGRIESLYRAEQAEIARTKKPEAPRRDPRADMIVGG